MKRKLLVAVPLLVLVMLLAWLLRPKHPSLGEAFVVDPSVKLYSSIAQVRESLETLHYGDRVDILARRNDNTKVRAADGTIGWMDTRFLMEPLLWQRTATLLTQAQTIPVQAHGRTKVQTNVRIAPSRTEPRLYQFNRGVNVDVVSRAVADWVQTSDEKEPTSTPRGSKKEDWFLVRGIATRPPGESSGRNNEIANTMQPADQNIPIAGWVIARFIEFDLPDPVRDGMNSANVRPMAWFELNRIPDPTGDKPQYLVAGTRGPEGQPCDFTILRVYTWDAKKTRYETAYIENDLCGQMPIRVGKSPKGEPEFRFREMNDGKQERVYRLMQTVIRRIHEGESTPHKPSHAVAHHAAHRAKKRAR